MIISHKYRFIFIKTIKTAGTSIEVYLSSLCGPEDVFTPIKPPLQNHQPRNYGRLYNHFSAWGLRQILSANIWDSYYKFCVERNPWDKVVSEFSMLNHQQGGALKFNDYIGNKKFGRNWELYTDTDNKTLMVDRVLRYEHLNQDLGEVFGELGVPWSGSLDVYAKSGYRKDQGSYREWFDDTQKSLIEDEFANEIKTFGYEF